MVTNFHFNCYGIMYEQLDAIGASLAVKQANVWMEKFEPLLQKQF